MLSSTYSKYLETSTLLILAVLIIENNRVVYLAPACEPEVIKTILLIMNGFTGRSAILLDISICPSSKQVNRSSQTSLV